MVGLVPVDERLTDPGAPGLSALCTDGVEPLVDAVLRSESGDGASFGAPAACDTPAGGIPAVMHPRTFLAIDPRDHQVVGTCGFSGPLRPDHGRMIWGETGKPGYGLFDRALGAAYLNGMWEALSSAGG